MKQNTLIRMYEGEIKAMKKDLMVVKSASSKRAIASVLEGLMKEHERLKDEMK